MTTTPGSAGGSWSTALGDATAELESRHAVAKLFGFDHTLWQDDPAEVANRLGWLSEPARMQGEVDTLRSFAEGVAADGFRHVVWCGMGGSSLFPELLSASVAHSGRAAPAVAFSVLDSSHPAAVARIARRVPLEHTLFCFASKSGGTLETRSHLDFFRARVAGPHQLVAITDTGSALDRLARDEGFRAVFNANPDIGGRYSALSHFGMVPAALLGLDVAAILAGGAEMATRCGPDAEGTASPAAMLAATLGAGVRTGHDKLTISTWGPFGDWVEQLVAESTGKHGTGILPVVREPFAAPDHYGTDRLFVDYRPEDPFTALAAAGHPTLDLGREDLTSGGAGLGREVVRWEIAIALAGALLGINPFDQPDVEAAKQAAGRVLDEGLPELPVSPVADALAAVGPGDYVAIQAFVDPDSADLAPFQAARLRIRDRFRVATTLAVGPRYLHSTGQLHKGGPPSGVFLQVLDADGPDVEIPGRSFTFGDLVRAQAAGDFEALRARDRRVFRVTASDLKESP